MGNCCALAAESELIAFDPKAFSVDTIDDGNDGVTRLRVIERKTMREWRAPFTFACLRALRAVNKSGTYIHMRDENVARIVARLIADGQFVIYLPRARTPQSYLRLTFKIEMQIRADPTVPIVVDSLTLLLAPVQMSDYELALRRTALQVERVSARLSQLEARLAYERNIRVTPSQ